MPNGVFRALSHPVRRQILQMLRTKDRSAGEIAEAFALTKPTLSGHFAKLKEADLIYADRQGTTLIYRLNVSVLEEAMLAFMSVMGLDEREKNHDAE